jgi:integrase
VAKRRSRGEGSPRRRKDGLYEFRITLPGTSGAKPRSISVYGKSLQDVADKAAALKASNPATRASGGNNAYTVGQALHDWLDAVAPGKRTVGRRAGITPRTWESYENSVRNHLAPLHSIPVTKLTTRDVNECIGLMTGAPRSIEKSWQILVTALNWLVAADVISKNPAKPASPPAVPRKAFEPISPADVRHLIEVIKGHPLEALFYLALTTGARQGELLALRWTDISLPQGNAARTVTFENTLVWTKQGPRFSPVKSASSGVASRTIELTKGATLRLTEHLRRLHDAGIMSERWEKMYKAKGWARTGFSTAGSETASVKRPLPSPKSASPLGDLIFVTSTGAPIRAKGSAGPLAQWKALQKRHGLPVRTFHDMRHVAASMMLAATKGDMFAVSKILGHADTRMLQRTYGHLVSHGSAAIRAYSELLKGL